MRLVVSLFIAAILVSLSLHVAAQNNESGYFDSPHVYVEDDIYMPVGLLAARMPMDKRIVWDAGSAYVNNSEFRSGGDKVQPSLGVQLWKLRVSATRLYGETALSVCLPFGINQVTGGIAGQPASKSGSGLGDLSVIGKRRIWSSNDRSDITVAAGLELPTGRDDLRFNQTNSITNSFYPGGSSRMPLAWQPGYGSTNLFTAISYNKAGYRRAYEATLACKINGKGDSDVRLGNVYVLSLNATQSLNGNAATSLGIVWRKQNNDSYPLAPAPGVGVPALAGITQHGTSVTISPSIRFKVSGPLMLGLSYTTPIVKPENGLVPQDRWGVIIAM